jgi:hypothetical protein
VVDRTSGPKMTGQIVTTHFYKRDEIVVSYQIALLFKYHSLELLMSSPHWSPRVPCDGGHGGRVGGRRDETAVSTVGGGTRDMRPGYIGGNESGSKMANVGQKWVVCGRSSCCHGCRRCGLAKSPSSSDQPSHGDVKCGRVWQEFNNRLRD